MYKPYWYDKELIEKILKTLASFYGTGAPITIPTILRKLGIVNLNIERSTAEALTMFRAILRNNLDEAVLDDNNLEQTMLYFGARKDDILFKQKIFMTLKYLHEENLITGFGKTIDEYIDLATDCKLDEAGFISITSKGINYLVEEN